MGSDRTIPNVTECNADFLQGFVILEGAPLRVRVGNPSQELIGRFFKVRRN
jgi:hypothetical protein